MKKRKGFTLTELFIGMLIQASLGLAMCGAFYMLLSFEIRVQKILTARERGQRVITFVENRIVSAGIGLQELKSSSEIRDALQPLTKTDRPLNNLMLPIAIISTDATNPSKDDLNTAAQAGPKYKDDNKTIIHGNILTVLYARKEEDSDVNLAILPLSDDDKTILQSRDINIGEMRRLTFLDNSTNQIIKAAGFKDFVPNLSAGINSNRSQDIRVWTVLAGTGVPLRIHQEDSYNKNVYVNFKAFKYNDSDSKITIHAGDELLYLKCEQMFVNFSTNELNFSFRTLDSKWGNIYPHEVGILGVYFELDTENNILDLWVLSTGGIDSVKHSHPPDWPKEAKPTEFDWNIKYPYEITYVSHKSWKLNNIPRDFNWS